MLINKSNDDHIYIIYVIIFNKKYLLLDYRIIYLKYKIL